MAKFLINYKKMIALATARKSPIGVNPFLLQLGKIKEVKDKDCN